MKEEKVSHTKLNLGLKSDHCEKWRSQLSLKMLEVCSSYRDQHFWLLDHSISSSYEKVMIEIRKRKLRENF